MLSVGGVFWILYLYMNHDTIDTWHEVEETVLRPILRVVFIRHLADKINL